MELRTRLLALSFVLDCTAARANKVGMIYFDLQNMNSNKIKRSLRTLAQKKCYYINFFVFLFHIISSSPLILRQKYMIKVFLLVPRRLDRLSSKGHIDFLFILDIASERQKDLKKLTPGFSSCTYIYILEPPLKITANKITASEFFFSISMKLSLKIDPKSCKNLFSLYESVKLLGSFPRKKNFINFKFKHRKK